MKKHLNKYYHQRKCSTIFVIIGTVLFFSFKFLLNLEDQIKANDITSIFNSQRHEKEDLGGVKIGFSFAIAIINLGLELLLMKTNIDTVNFKNDVNVARKS